MGWAQRPASGPRARRLAEAVRLRASIRALPLRASVRGARLLAAFGTILVPLAVFGLLAEDVWEQEPFVWDIPLIEAARALASPAADRAMLATSVLGAPRVMLLVIVAVAVALHVRGHRQHAVFLALSGVGAGLLNSATKALFQRPRPDFLAPLVAENDFAFPSGHAMGTLAVALALAVLAWDTRWRWPVMAGGAVFVAAVGLSRVYLGVHYPSDVLAGWLASAAWVMACRFAVPRIGDLRRRRLAAPAAIGS